MRTIAQLERELKELAEEELCHECHAVLTEDEKELGYVCSSCVNEWIDEAFNVMEA